MKITTWNVNGFRAVLNKGNFGWVADESPDILCLQEVKAKEEQIEDSLRRMDGYDVVWNAAEFLKYASDCRLCLFT